MTGEISATQDQVNTIMNELREVCDSSSEAIFVLLICLYELAMSNEVEPEIAIEDYKEVFLSIKRVYEDRLN